MRQRVVIALLATAAFLAVAGQAAGARAPVAALQVALREHGLYHGKVDGLRGPLTHGALLEFQRKRGIQPTGRLGRLTRTKLGVLGRPLLGQRELSRGRVGWDVASLEFRLRSFGLPRPRVDGRFDGATVEALRRFQRARGLRPDGIVGVRTFRALARGPASVATRASAVYTVRPGEGFIVIARRYGVSVSLLARANGLTVASVLSPGQRLRVPGGTTPPATTRRSVATPGAVHVVVPGESFFSISQRYKVSPWKLARVNRLPLISTIVPGQRLMLPRGAHASTWSPVDRDTVRAEIDHWAVWYGVDPQLARALAWMESGFQQDVVSSAGAVGVMQLLPETWVWVDTLLLGEITPRNYVGNVRAGVRYLRWQLDQFGGDVRLALAGYYQGARAVRERGLFEDTKQYVSVILQLYGSV